MKAKGLLVLVTILGTFSLVVGCADRADMSSEKEAVQAVITQSFFAVQNQDWETLRRLFQKIGCTSRTWDRSGICKKCRGFSRTTYQITELA